MELSETFDILLRRDKLNEALEYVHNNKSEVTGILIEKLQCAINNIEAQQELVTDYDLGCVLNLLAELEAKNAFPFLIKILEFKGKDVFFGLEHMSSMFFGSILFKTASDETDIITLKDYVMRQDIQGVNKLSAYYAVQAFYSMIGERKEDLEEFNREIVLSFNENGFDYFENHGLLLSVIDCSLHEEFFGLYEDIQNLLIKLIIKSESGHKFSGYRSYFEYLYRLDPLMPAKIHAVKKYIIRLRYCADEEIFQFDTLANVGKYLFSKVLGAVESTNCEIVKMAVKQLNEYPINDRKIPYTDEQYYEEICYYLDICEIPKNIYTQAKELYESVFGIGYIELRQKIEILIQETIKLKKELKNETDEIIKRTNKNRSVKKNVETNITELIECHFKEKELNALYKYEDSHESGLLVYYLSELEKFFSSFCEDIDNTDKIDEKLRETSIKCICLQNISIEDMFAQYRRVIEQYDVLLDECPYNTLYKIFYQVKFIPFSEKIQLEFWPKLVLKNSEERKCNRLEFEKKINNHPLNPLSLYDCFNNNILKYKQILEKFLCETATQIRECISNSICLNKRKSVIEKCILTIENGDDELAINLLPTQIEGLVVDLLEYSTIYEYVQDIEQYKKILNMDLVYKIEFIRRKGINLSFNAIAYFKFYFNNIVRNTVAHGNYDLLVRGGRVREESRIDAVDKRVIKRIIALELLLDLQYLVYMISRINEIDTAKKYIDEIYENYSSSLKEEDMNIFYDCMFDDLSGMRNRYKLSDYKSGIFVTYEPLQIFYWIFNPYYEKYLDNKKLSEIREIICSFEFWMSIEDKLSANIKFRKFDTKLFQMIVNKIFQLDLADNVKQIIKKVNAEL